MIIEPLFLSIAGFNIGIKFKKTDPPGAEMLFRNRIQDFYNDFIFLGDRKKIDFCIEVNQRKNFEVYIQQKNKNDVSLRKNFIIFFEEKGNRKISTFYHISMQQLQLILRDICQKLLAENGGLITHASSVLVKGSADIFLGPSGAGKSTAMKIVSTKYPALADDMIIIRKEGATKYFAYQTPFKEKNALSGKSPKKYDLGKIFFLRKSRENKVIKIQKKEQIIQLVIKQFFTKQEHLNIQMKNILEFVANFNDFYILSFNLKNNSEVIELMSNA